MDGLRSSTESRVRTVVVEVAAGAELKHQVQLRRGVDHFVQAHDVRVLHQLQAHHLLQTCTRLNPLRFDGEFISNRLFN